MYVAIVVFAGIITSSTYAQDVIGEEDAEHIVIFNDDNNPSLMFDRMLADRVLWHGPGDGAFLPNARLHRRLGFLADDTLREMEKDARDLARKARREEDGDKATLETELDQKLSEIFDYKNGRRREAIETTEKRLDEMRERLSKRESSRIGIIEQRRQELLGEESYLEW